METFIELVGRFNSMDFSNVPKDTARLFMLNECLKNGLSIHEANVVIVNVRF